MVQEPQGALHMSAKVEILRQMRCEVFKASCPEIGNLVCICMHYFKLPQYGYLVNNRVSLL